MPRITWIKVAAIISIIAVTLATLSVLTSRPSQSTEVVITATLAAPKERWDLLFAPAVEELQRRHPDLKVKVDYEVLPYAQTRSKLLTMMTGGTPRDLVSVDVIWLGELAEGGFLMDLTDNVKEWDRMDQWFEENRVGGMYNGKVYGIWSWTDVRVLWFWKDLLSEAGVTPENLGTWDGYLEAARKLNAKLRPNGIEGVHLVGASHSPDMWFPYLWMLDGEILEMRKGHPSKGEYWYPAYHRAEGVKALEFLARQVKAGVKPQMDHFWGQEFADRKFAVMLEGSWLLGSFPKKQWATLKERIGMIPIFPVPEKGAETSTMMGGWVMSIPATSKRPDLAWELLTILESPNILTEMLSKFGYLPTQKPIADGTRFADMMEKAIPFYRDLIKVLPQGRTRPNIPEYPQIAEHIRVALEEVYFNKKTSEEALRDAADKSAKVLGWPGLQ